MERLRSSLPQISWHANFSIDFRVHAGSRANRNKVLRWRSPKTGCCLEFFTTRQPRLGSIVASAQPSVRGMPNSNVGYRAFRTLRLLIAFCSNTAARACGVATETRFWVGTKHDVTLACIVTGPCICLIFLSRYRIRLWVRGLFGRQMCYACLARQYDASYWR